MIQPPDPPNTFRHLNELMEYGDVELTALLDQIGRSPDSLLKVQEFLVGFLFTIRFNTLVDLDEVGELWEYLRSEEVLTDLVLDHTTVLVLHADTLQPQGWQLLTRAVADAWGCLNPDQVSPGVSVVHVAKETERFVRPSVALKLIRANPWLVSLYTLRQSTYVRRVMSEMATRAAQSRGRDGQEPVV